MSRAMLVAVLVALVAAPAALADGDPASDILPQRDVYYPYSPQPAAPLVETLDGLLADVRDRGYPMKVALIASAADLGAYPTMFNNPQVYANLLSAQLPQNPHGTVKDELHLLVVMPGGFGGSGLGDRVDEALSGVRIDADAASDGLVRAAIEAVAKLASVNGTETAVPEIPEVAEDGSEGGGGGAGTAGIIIAAVAVLGLLIAVAVVQLRRRRESDERPDEGAEAQGNGLENRSQ